MKYYLRMQVCSPFSEILTNAPWQTSSRRAWNSVSAVIRDPKFGSEVMFGKSTGTGWAHRDLQFWTRTTVRDRIIEWKLLAVGSGLTSNVNQSKMIWNPNTIPDTGFISQKQILMQPQLCAALWVLWSKKKQNKDWPCEKWPKRQMWAQISGQHTLTSEGKTFFSQIYQFIPCSFVVESCNSDCSHNCEFIIHNSDFTCYISKFISHHFESQLVTQKLTFLILNKYL